MWLRQVSRSATILGCSFNQGFRAGRAMLNTSLQTESDGTGPRSGPLADQHPVCLYIHHIYIYIYRYINRERERCGFFIDRQNCAQLIGPKVDPNRSAKIDPKMQTTSREHIGEKSENVHKQHKKPTSTSTNTSTGTSTSTSTSASTSTSTSIRTSTSTSTNTNTITSTNGTTSTSPSTSTNTNTSTSTSTSTNTNTSTCTSELLPRVTPQS